MAVVTRYFGVEDAGVGDGSSWANRAALFDGNGNWSGVLTGFDFSGADSLLCLIGPGTYLCKQSLSGALFSTAPGVLNMLIMHGCDDAGTPLSPSDPGWVSAQPPWDESLLPVITSNMNDNIIALSVVCRLLKFVSLSGRAGAVLSVRRLEWCSVVQATSSSSADGVGNECVNCLVYMTGTTYRYALSTGGAGLLYNCRVMGNPSASSGIRAGIYIGNSTSTRRVVGCTSVDHHGDGILIGAPSGVGHLATVYGCTIYNNGGHGVKVESGGSNNLMQLSRLMVANNGGYGISGGDGIALVSNSRLRDNTSGNFNTLGNYPDSLDNLVSGGLDADEFVGVANGDYRIKYGSSIWGKGYGAGDEPAPAAGAPLVSPHDVREGVDRGDGVLGLFKGDGTDVSIPLIASAGFFPDPPDYPDPENVKSGVLYALGRKVGTFVGGAGVRVSALRARYLRRG